MPTSMTWPRPVVLLVAQREHHADRAVQAGDVVAERRGAGHHRRLAGKAGEVGQPAEGVGDVREAGAAAVGAGLAVAGDAQHHQAGVGLAAAPPSRGPTPPWCPGGSSRPARRTWRPASGTARRPAAAAGRWSPTSCCGPPTARRAWRRGAWSAVPKRRIGSPAIGCSTLSTSAPNSPRIDRGIGAGEEVADVDDAHAVERQRRRWPARRLPARCSPRPPPRCVGSAAVVRSVWCSSCSDCTSWSPAIRRVDPASVTSRHSLACRGGPFVKCRTRSASVLVLVRHHGISIGRGAICTARVRHAPAAWLGASCRLAAPGEALIQDRSRVAFSARSCGATSPAAASPPKVLTTPGGTWMKPNSPGSAHRRGLGVRRRAVVRHDAGAAGRRRDPLRSAARAGSTRIAGR